MQFVITAYDYENNLDQRMMVRGRHIANMERLGSRVILGGGLLDEEGRMKGSVLVLDFDSREDLEEYLRTEPYNTDHVWEKIDVECMNVVYLKGEKVGK